MDQLKTAAQWIEEASRILIFTGAGISTSSGIPDFRGPKGLYSRVQQEYGLPFAEALFDINYFQQHPQAFFSFSRELFSMEPQPSLSHRYLAELERRGKVELLVTQNIDMLHHRAGSKKVMECHGTYRTGSCMTCGKAYELAEFQSSMERGEIPRCSSSGKSGAGHSSRSLCSGVIKPDIVFFGEALPEAFYELMQAPPVGDLLLVVGSSLTVHPAATIPMDAARVMRSIFINLESTGMDGNFDLVIHDEADRVFEALGKVLD